MSENSPWRFCVAPMLDWTDRHQRVFARTMTRQTRLYTEMVTTGALIYGDPTRHLDFSIQEQPVALQLGGADPQALADCAQMGESWGYKEINLNIGCPSNRVKNGRFGACLMATPTLVAKCVKAMRDAVNIPVTVKCRLGIDEQNTESDLDRFVDTVTDDGGCGHFIIHARKAWLNGLSPKENRNVPPLDYDRVRRLKERKPELTVVLNGGLQSITECQKILSWADGVMMGRSAYQNPRLLLSVDPVLFNKPAPVDNTHAVAEHMQSYAEKQLAKGEHLAAITRHMLGLFKGCPNGRLWRQMLTGSTLSKQSKALLITEAAALVPKS